MRRPGNQPVTETSFPEVSILRLHGNELTLIKRFRAWVDDGDSEERIKFEYNLKGECLEIVAAELSTVDTLCPGVAGEKNDLSFDMRFTLAEDGPLSVDDYDQTADRATNIYGVHVGPVARLWLPGRCDGTENVSQWPNPDFFGTHRITDFRANAIYGSDGIAKVSCAPNIAINLERGNDL
ncbi:hypothetical protein GGQ64_004591 [Rhizobium azooxidifex]|uniref:Uncharacterized protein n=1 Tax=Mycoplana azooxidifex TaxID=1636188 RepID=A0A7W6GKR1_9HYPH|nr:hypothetical protein [Mycoplana azooxidifex]MBB3979351.1 hypothetical protein [Mycoplana azooxidifex]